MAAETATYEHMRDQIINLKRASTATDRVLIWADFERSLAFARDGEGNLEVFIVGEPIFAASKMVGEVLEHQVWTADDGLHLPASRIVLPPGEHFDQLAATVGVELLQHALVDDAQSAFMAVEPLIALALTRESVTDLALIGLIGELTLMESVLGSVAAELVPQLVDAWAGSAPSARDFQFGSVGVEVKTTQGHVSTHHVEGVHQVELGRSNDGVAETALYMLSLGLRFVSDPTVGRTLPDLIDSILECIPVADDRIRLLARIRQYGGDAAVGYDHHRDRGKPRYAKRYYLTFERLYDLTDERLKLLASRHLAGLSNIDPGSVNFRVALEDRVRGMHNPISGWDEIRSKIVPDSPYS